MNLYRCYFLDAMYHVRAEEDFEADAPAPAIKRALAMLRERPHHHSIELWQGARKVYPDNLAPPN